MYSEKIENVKHGPYIAEYKGGSSLHETITAPMITDLEKAPKFPPEFVAEMEKWNHLILWVDDNVVSGVNHCPLINKKVTRPIFHFTVVTSPTYSMT